MELEIITDNDDIAAAEVFLYDVDPKRRFPHLILLYGGAATLVLMMIFWYFIFRLGIFKDTVTVTTVVVLEVVFLIGLLMWVLWFPKLLYRGASAGPKNSRSTSPIRATCVARALSARDDKGVHTAMADRAYELSWEEVEMAGENDVYFFVFPKEEAKDDRVVFPKKQLSQGDIAALRSLLDKHTELKRPQKK